MKTRDSERDTKIVENLGLVHMVANRYSGCEVDYDDLVGGGTIGLILAVDKYDEERGFTFSTFAVPWIRKYVLLEIRGATREHIGVRDDLPEPSSEPPASNHYSADVKNMLTVLKPMLRETLERRYGLKNYHPHTYPEIAEEMDCGLSTAWTRERRALERLRVFAEFTEKVKAIQ